MQVSLMAPGSAPIPRQTPPTIHRALKVPLRFSNVVAVDQLCQLVGL
jgi:hypothetical protein